MNRFFCTGRRWLVMARDQRVPSFRSGTCGLGNDEYVHSSVIWRLRTSFGHVSPFTLHGGDVASPPSFVQRAERCCFSVSDVEYVKLFPNVLRGSTRNMSGVPCETRCGQRSTFRVPLLDTTLFGCVKTFARVPQLSTLTSTECQCTSASDFEY